MDLLGVPTLDQDLLRPKAPPNKPPRTFSSTLDSRPSSFDFAGSEQKIDVQESQTDVKKSELSPDANHIKDSDILGLDSERVLNQTDVEPVKPNDKPVKPEEVVYAVIDKSDKKKKKTKPVILDQVPNNEPIYEDILEVKSPISIIGTPVGLKPDDKPGFDFKVEQNEPIEAEVIVKKKKKKSKSKTREIEENSHKKKISNASSNQIETNEDTIDENVVKEKRKKKKKKHDKDLENPADDSKSKNDIQNGFLEHDQGVEDSKKSRKKKHSKSKEVINDTKEIQDTLTNLTSKSLEVPSIEKSSRKDSKMAYLAESRLDFLMEQVKDKIAENDLEDQSVENGKDSNSSPPLQSPSMVKQNTIDHIDKILDQSVTPIESSNPEEEQEVELKIHDSVKLNATIIVPKRRSLMKIEVPEAQDESKNEIIDKNSVDVPNPTLTNSSLNQSPDQPSLPEMVDSTTMAKPEVEKGLVKDRITNKKGMCMFV